MKKKYSKPVAVFESFQLDTSVASCTGDGGIPIGRTQESCYFVAADAVYFMSGNEYCNTDVVNDPNPSDPNDTFCYHGYNNIMGATFISS